MTIQLTLDKTAIAHILEVAGDELLIKLKANIVDQVVRSKVKSSLNDIDRGFVEKIIQTEVGHYSGGWNNKLVLSDNFIANVKQQLKPVLASIIDDVIVEHSAAMEKRYQKALDEHCQKMISKIPKKTPQEIELIRAIRAYKENKE